MSLEAADTVPVMGKGSRLLHTCCDEFRERLLLISTRVILLEFVEVALPLTRV